MPEAHKGSALLDMGFSKGSKERHLSHCQVYTKSRLFNKELSRGTAGSGLRGTACSLTTALVVEHPALTRRARYALAPSIRQGLALTLIVTRK